ARAPLRNAVALASAVLHRPAASVRGGCMQKQIVRVSELVVCIAALVLGGASVSRADETVAKVKVPFAFFVNDVRLPAGDYIVRAASDDGQVLEIVGTDGHRVAFSPSIPWNEDKQTTQLELVFEKFGGAYFLSRIV